eukprot:g165.t1
MKFRSARTVVQEHISNVNAFQDSLQTPPLPPTLITEHANGEGGKAAIVAPSSPPSLAYARGSSTKNVPWTDEKYLKTLYDACECIGYALEKDSTTLMKEQMLIQCLVNTLRQIISPNHSIQNESSFSPDENRSGNDANPTSGRYEDLATKLSKTSIHTEKGSPPQAILDSWVFGPEFTPKILFSIVECISFMTEHDEYDEMLLCVDIVDVLSRLSKYAVIERSIESSFNPFPARVQDVDDSGLKYLVNNDTLYTVLDCIKDLSASDEIENYLADSGIVDVIGSLLPNYPMESDIVTVSMLALANLTTNSKAHKNSKSHRACVQPTVQILVHEKSSKKAKECAAAVLRNFSADPRTKLCVAEYDGIRALLHVLKAYKFNTKKAKQQDAEVANGKHTDTNVQSKKAVYLSLVTKRDAVGALRNLSTHDDCDEDIVRHGGIEFFISNLAEIIHQYENKSEFRDSLESCISGIRNVCVSQEVTHQFINHSIGLKLLASVILDDRYPYICRGEAVKAMENLAMYVTEDLVVKFVDSNAIESLIAALETEFEDESISKSAVVTLGYLVAFENGKSTIVKFGGRSMVTMLNLNRRQKAEAEKDKRVSTSPPSKDAHATKRKKRENKLGFGGKSSRFGDAFIQDIERRK